MAKKEARDKNPKQKAVKKKEKKTLYHGIVYIRASFNNTLLTITDQEGNLVVWSSAGSLGFKGSRKGTPFAAQQAALAAGRHEALPQRRTLFYRQVCHREAQLRPRSTRKEPSSENPGLRAAAQRKAEGEKDIRLARETVSQLLRARRAPARDHWRNPAATPGAATGQRRLSPGIRKFPSAGLSP